MEEEGGERREMERGCQRGRWREDVSTSRNTQLHEAYLSHSWIVAPYFSFLFVAAPQCPERLDPRCLLCFGTGIRWRELRGNPLKVGNPRTRIRESCSTSHLQRGTARTRLSFSSVITEGGLRIERILILESRTNTKTILPNTKTILPDTQRTIWNRRSDTAGSGRTPRNQSLAFKESKASNPLREGESLSSRALHCHP